MSIFLPNMYQKSIYTINYKKLLKKNIKCILFDIDNTCVGYKEKTPSKQMISLFKELKKYGFKVIIFSNARKKRLEPFKILEVDINHLSKKPLSSSFNKVLKKYNLNKEEVIIIGDQLLTDIIGGNKVGINTCLIDPLTKDDFFITKLSRKIENNIFKKLEKKKELIRGHYYE